MGVERAPVCVILGVEKAPVCVILVVCGRFLVRRVGGYRLSVSWE